MKVTRQQLDELIRYISKAVLKEYSSMTSSEEDKMDKSPLDLQVKPTDSQTSAEKLKDKQALDQAKKRKDTEKEKADSFKSQYEQWRRYGKQNDEKAVKDLQTKVASRGSMSSVAENIRKMRA